ncbi:hypothetical protein GOBAR_DD35350 [Gossypium barbadense]|nr:hypothetical protein GOBAR_DD35350 [Gossypium barbadense]
MAVAVFKSPLRGEYPRNNRMEGKQPVGRRRVFVQTETGCVLGMELDRSDSAHTVKRRLQVALNFPAEQSSLTFGDVELKNDLSAVRNDSPLLLTRNYLHRSSSTPCLSPTGKDLQQRDKSGPIEILGHSDSFNVLKVVVKDIVKAIKMGVDPLPVHSGLGGAYYFRNPRGENVAIVKPTDEEPFAPNNPKGFVGKALGQPGLKRSVRVGETGFREVVAYLLDHDHFANVPPTALVKITHSVFNVNGGVNRNRPHKNLVSKIASCQQFIRHDFDARILDIRIFNTDRHAGNLLVRKLDGIGRFGQMELIPIDHGLCLPETLEDPYFEWIHWPQASIPFSEDELEYIQKLDPMKDCEMLRRELPMIREACLRVLVLCTIFLKEAAAFGLCLAEIGEMMSREFRAGEEEPSELEVICLEARRLIAERELSSPKSDVRDAEFQFDIDFEEPELDLNPKMATDDFMSRAPFQLGNGFLSMSFKNTSLGDKSQKYSKFSGTKQENGYLNNSSGHRSANEQLPGNVSFVKLADMNEEEWNLFLEKFQELLYPGFEKRKSVTLGQKQIQRLLSMSFKNTSLGDKSQKYSKFSGTKQENGYLNNSSGHRSATEQLPGNVSFVKLADMNEEEWTLFLEKFQELLYPGFEKRKSVTLGQKQIQRLGTSCQF